jgi:hypothetical protein
MHRGAVAGVGLILACVLTGCGGGGSSARYSKPAMVKCLQDHGVPSQDISHPVTAEDKQVAKLLRPIAPNTIVAQFNSDEFVGISFAADSAGATRILHAFQKLAKSPGATPGTIRKVGNLVLLQDPHPTQGTQQTLATCEKQAKLT